MDDKNIIVLTELNDNIINSNDDNLQKNINIITDSISIFEKQINNNDNNIVAVNNDVIINILDNVDNVDNVDNIETVENLDKVFGEKFGGK